MTLKAIETRYAGCRFRSRLEARWAVFFDSLGVKWEYEPEGFELPGGERYLPDFRLPCPGVTLSLWVEIKPVSPSEAEIQKLTHVVDAQKQTSGIFGVGLPGAETHKRDWCFDEALFDAPRWEIIPLWRALSHAEMLPAGDAYRRAVTAAKSARFEFGESGAA